ncbi:hypothetical protein E4U33_003490 [Claviceps sp. LM78 group G4]|nr:hypothetical protein E4U33_003490 [Claviceps sp. LM78 group G4]
MKFVYHLFSHNVFSEIMSVPPERRLRGHSPQIKTKSFSRASRFNINYNNELDIFVIFRD